MVRLIFGANRGSVEERLRIEECRSGKDRREVFIHSFFLFFFIKKNLVRSTVCLKKSGILTSGPTVAELGTPLVGCKTI